MKLIKNIKVELSETDRRELYRLSNLHFLGDEDCNIWSEEKGCYVAKHPEKETEEMKDVHWRIRNGTFHNKVKIEIDPVTCQVTSWKIAE